MQRYSANFYDETSHGVSRGGNLYQDFCPMMVVDAIYADREYRSLFMSMMDDKGF